MSTSKVISGDSAASAERWQLPEVRDGRARRPAVETVPAGQAVQPLTAQQIEQIQKEARREGYEQGRKEGWQAGQKEIQATVHRLEQIILAFAAPLADVDERVEQELVGLAIAIARQIIRRELKTDPGQIVGVVREALAALPAASRQVKVFLHPEDAALVRETLLPLNEAAAEVEPANWRVVDDPLLTRGGCRITSEHSQVDATVEQRIAAIVAQILGGERRDDRANDSTES